MAFDAEFIEGFDKYGVSGRVISVANDMPGEWNSLWSPIGYVTALTLAAPLVISTGCALTLSGSPSGSGFTDSGFSKTLSGNFVGFIGGITLKSPLTTSAVGVTFADAGTAQVGVYLETTGNITVRRGGAQATIIATSAESVAANSVNCIEWALTINNATATIKVWLNGVLTSINLTGQNTRGGTSNNYANGLRLVVGVSSGSFGNMTVDHLYNHLYSTSLGSDTPLLYNPVIETQFASSDSSVQFTPTAAVLGSDYSVTASTNAPGANQLALRKFTPVENATINSVSILPAATSAGAKLKGVIYSDSAGSPDALLSSGTEVVGTTSGTLATLPLVTPQALTGGTPYWIGYITDTSVALSQVDTTTTGQKAANTYASGAPGTAPAMTAGQVSWIVFGNCTSLAANWPSVSNTYGNPPLGDLSYTADGTVGHGDLFGFPALNINAQAIAAVAVKGWIERSDAGARTIDLTTHSGSTTSTGSAPAQAPGTSYAWMSSYFDTDPNGSIAWTKAHLDSATSGYDIAS